MKLYSKLIIFYFSGTGNAKRASEWIIDVAKNKNIETKLVNIDSFRFTELPVFNEKTLIGFASPTHGFNLPPIMLKFIYNFPKIENADFFIFNTRAGMKLHKLFLPGLSGVAQILPAIYLKSKGYSVVGLQPMDLPSNWISVHPGLKEKVVLSIFNRCEKITKRFANKILSGKKVYKGLISLPIDLLISPISLGYYLFGRFAIAKTFIATNACNNCGLCLKKCPTNAITEVQGRMYWTFNCESCMRCMNNCPKRAIETAHSFTFVLWWFAFSFLPSIAISKAIDYQLFNTDKFPQWIEAIDFFVSSFIAIINIYLAYKLLHYLMSFKFFNKLVAYTSLTRFKFWRRYKAPKK